MGILLIFRKRKRRGTYSPSESREKGASNGVNPISLRTTAFLLGGVEFDAIFKDVVTRPHFSCLSPFRRMNMGLMLKKVDSLAVPMVQNHRSSSNQTKVTAPRR